MRIKKNVKKSNATLFLILVSGPFTFIKSKTTKGDTGIYGTCTLFYIWAPTGTLTLFLNIVQLFKM